PGPVGETGGAHGRCGSDLSARADRGVGGVPLVRAARCEPRRHHRPREPLAVRKPPAARLIALLGAMALAFAGVVARLAVLQTRDSSVFTRLGYDQRVHTLVLPAARGE